MTEIESYIASVKKHLNGKVATEHTYRGALSKLVEALGVDITATNEPKRIKCGAPDFIVTTGNVPLGYIEAKDVGVSLDKEEHSEQMGRYLPSLTNLILTDYVEFRWYVNGEQRLTAALGSVNKKGLLHVSEEGPGAVEELLTAFLNADIPTVSSPRELASRMAAAARLLRSAIELALEEEGDSGPLNEQMDGFREVLLHDLKKPQFADMYAQTIAYGLFAARANADPDKVFTREHAAYDLPKTNPFLRQLFGLIAGPDLTDSIVWAVDDIAELLHRADMPAVLKDFGQRTKRQDPILHFYETFLAEYDPTLREKRGVYYTPEPVVDYIVHSVDHVLKNSFGLKGLADHSKISIKNPHQKGKISVHKVIVLDPATGTGTFLHAVVDLVHDTITAKSEGMWSGYVRDHLLPRLFGFELLMAPYAMAHMKLGLQLAESGYDFASNERLGVYLTNTLEEVHSLAKLPLFQKWIAEEANAANRVKQDAPVMVVMGNPPYSGHSANSGEWITALIEDYKKIDGTKVRLGQGKWLQNDYVKFIRFAQHRIDQTGYGVLAMITDHSYIDSGTFVAMRANLLSFFDDIYILDLNGNSKRNKNRLDVDNNVFDITQGVAIIVAVKREGTKKGEATLRTASLRGSRSAKYDYLTANSIATTEWEIGQCKAPYYLFAATDGSHLTEYEGLPSITDVFPGTYGGQKSKRVGTGFVSTHDDFAIAFDEALLKKKVQSLLDTDNEEEARELFTLCGQTQWDYAKAKVALKAVKWREQIRQVLYRPFDERVTVWNPHVCVHRRLEVNQHLYDGNIALLVGQAGNVVGAEEWGLAFATKQPADFNVFYRGGSAVLPMLLSTEAENGELFDSSDEVWRANLDIKLIEKLTATLKAKFTPLGNEKPNAKTFSALDVTGYVYAILYSPTYRERYSQFLMVDFPRIPFTSDGSLFRRLAQFGRHLLELHLGDYEPPAKSTFPAKGSDVVEDIGYAPPEGDSKGRVQINAKQYFGDVQPETWNFQIGGYQVCHKWLKDRKGLKLSFDEIAHYQRILDTIRLTISIMQGIDEAIEKSGGWPLGALKL